MNNLSALMRVNLRLMFAIDRSKDIKKEIAKKVLIGVLCLLIAVCVCVVMAFVAAAVGIDNCKYLLASIMFMSQVYVLFFGVAQYVSAMFFSKDNEFLMALPIRPYVIFMSKLLTSYLTFLSVSLLVQVPSFIAVGIMLKISSAMYYILGIVGACLVPMLPLLIVSILAFPIAYIANLFRRKGIFGTIVLTVLFIGFFAAYMYAIMALQNQDYTGMTPEEIMAMVSEPFKVMAKIIYPNLFLATAMTAAGGAAWANLGYFILVMLGAGGIAIGISALLYRDSATKFTEHTAPIKVKKGDNKSKKAIPAMVIRDIKCSLGEASQAFNYIVGIVLIPIIVLILSMNVPTDSAGLGAAVSSSATAILMLCGTNYFAIIAFSREGKNISLLRMLPVSNRDIIRSKFVLADAYTILAALLSGLMLIVCKADVLFILLYILSASLVGCGVNGYLLVRDMRKPMLDWQNLRVLMKRNMGALVGMLLAFPVLILQIVMMVLAEVGVIVDVSNTVYALIVQGPTLLLGIIYIIVFRVIMVSRYRDTLSSLE